MTALTSSWPRADQPTAEQRRTAPAMPGSHADTAPSMRLHACCEFHPGNTSVSALRQSAQAAAAQDAQCAAVYNCHATGKTASSLHASSVMYSRYIPHMHRARGQPLRQSLDLASACNETVRHNCEAQLIAISFQQVACTAPAASNSSSSSSQLQSWTFRLKATLAVARELIQ